MRPDTQILSAASSMTKALKALRAGDRSQIEALRSAHCEIGEALEVIGESPVDDTLEDGLNEALADIEAGRVSQPTDDIDKFLETLKRDAAALHS